MKFFSQAQPAGLDAGLEGGGPRQELPLDGGVQPLVLQLPDVASQSGPNPLVAVPEVVRVVVVPQLVFGIYWRCLLTDFAYNQLYIHTAHARLERRSDM